MAGEILLISIKPEYANKIFDGTKTVELRRVKPRLKSDDWVLVYVSTPVRALVGMFQVESVVESSPTRLWSQVKDHAGVTREQFYLYYAGTDRAYGIFLKTFRHLPRAIDLGYLKRKLYGFQPPQSYRYLTPDEARLVDYDGQEMRKPKPRLQMPGSRLPTLLVST